MFQSREKRGMTSKIEEGLSPELRKEQFYKNRIEALGISGVEIRKEGLASLEKRRHELRNLFKRMKEDYGKDKIPKELMDLYGQEVNKLLPKIRERQEGKAPEE